jgi:hypothetical protein
MKIYHAFVFAITGFVVAAPLRFAQTPSSPTKTTAQTAGKQHPETGASSGGSSSQYPDRAHKQATQGLPPGLAPDTGASWNNNQNQPAKHE